jgi:magnesium transporter
MIRAYSLAEKAFVVVDIATATELPEPVTWLDLDHPTAAEEAWLQGQLEIEIPTREDMRGIEPSSRLYQEGASTYMTATLLWKADSDVPETTNIGFVLSRGRLITVRYADSRPFNVFQAHIERKPDLCGSGAVALIGLLETVVDRTAEVLERMVGQVDTISKRISERRRRTTDKRRSSMELEVHMNDLVFNQNVAAQVRDSLVSLGRMVAFMPVAPELQSRNDHPDIAERMNSIAHDVQSLIDHTGFVNANLNFLLDASLGFINIEQNAIIKIFSIAAVVFLPPTMVASVYGMNFTHMPELAWRHGYLFALLLMLASGVLPYLWFKRKGWL